jgi:dTDP-D-glucose 4,6-dehydratase
VTSSETFWSGKLVLVTGGASFIGSTLTDHLLARAAKVRFREGLKRTIDWYYATKKPRRSEPYVRPHAHREMRTPGKCSP